MLRKEYCKKGFVIVPQVLSSDEINQLRALLLKEYKQQSINEVEPVSLNDQQVFAMPKICMTTVSDKVVAALKEIFGQNYVMLPDLNVLKDTCGPWHVDCGSEIPNSYLMASDYSFAKCGIYLQDNSPEWGGGVDVVPRHHKFPVRIVASKYAHKIKSVYNHLGTKFLAQMAETKAGDLLVFDSRLPHRATQPQQLNTLPQIKKGRRYKLIGMPDDKAKLSIYWNVCSRVFEAQDYLKNSIKRAKTETNDGYMDSNVHSGVIAMEYPRSFQSEFVKRIEEVGVVMGCTNKILSNLHTA